MDRNYISMLTESFDKLDLGEGIGDSLLPDLYYDVQSKLLGAGYDVRAKETKDYIWSVLDYLDCIQAVDRGYTVDDWFNDTKQNYPDELKELPRQFKEDLKEGNTAEEQIINAIKTNDFEHDEEAEYVCEYPVLFKEVSDGKHTVRIQFNDLESHEIHIKKLPNGGYRNADKNPRVSSNTWCRIWINDDFVFNQEGPKYKIRQEAIEFLEMYDWDIEFGECLTEAKVTPGSEEDSEVLRSIQKKIAGKKFDLKKLSDEERAVLDKYGLNAWGYKGDTKMVTPGRQDVLSNDRRYSTAHQKRVNIADRATKIDDRAQNFDIKNTYVPGEFRPTYKQKNDQYVNNQISKDTSTLKSKLTSRKNWQKVLDTDADADYEKSVKRAAAERDSAVAKEKDWGDRSAKYAQDYDNEVNSILDKVRNRTKKAVECYLESLNEDVMSDEDRADSDALRQIQAKLDKRSNAKLSDDEINLLNKLGLIRTDYGSLYVKNRKDGRNAQVNINPSNSKVNYADMAKKRQERDGQASYHYNSLDNEREHVNSEISADTRHLQTALYGRKSWLKNKADSDKKIANLNQDYEDTVKRKADYRDSRKEMARQRISDTTREIDDFMSARRKHEALKKAPKKSHLCEAAYNDSDETRVVKTSLPDTDINNEILRSVIGQMSDGMWENSPAMEKYWKYADINGTDIVVDDIWESPYKDKSDAEICKFFGNKVKAIAQQYLHDNNMNPYDNWNENCDEECTYLNYHEPVTIGDAYIAFKTLTGKR